MTTTNKLTDFERARLNFSLQDWRNAPAAYPILAAHGLMERTANGFKAIDPESVRTRTLELLS